MLTFFSCQTRKFWTYCLLSPESVLEKVAPHLKKIQSINNDEDIFVFTKIKTMQLQQPYCLAITTAIKATCFLRDILPQEIRQLTNGKTNTNYDSTKFTIWHKAQVESSSNSNICTYMYRFVPIYEYFFTFLSL